MRGARLIGSDAAENEPPDQARERHSVDDAAGPHLLVDPGAASHSTCSDSPGPRRPDVLAPLARNMWKNRPLSPFIGWKGNSSSSGPGRQPLSSIVSRVAASSFVSPASSRPAGSSHPQESVVKR